MPAPQARDRAGRFAPTTRTEVDLVALPAPTNRLLVDLEEAGYVTDEWARWQQGCCGAYAIALCRMDPNLTPVVLGTRQADGGWREDH